MSAEATTEDEKSHNAQDTAPTGSTKRPTSERQDSNNGCEKNAQKGTEADDSHHEELSSIAKFSILGPVTLAYFLWFLDLAVVSTATPKITSEFNSLSQIGWYGGAYQLGSSAFTPLTGKIFRSFSIKWSFITFFLIFELGSVLCGAAQSSPMFIVGRGVAGVGSCGIATGALTIISAILKPRAQASFLGINQGIGQIGLAIGPVLGGAFTSYVSWRWCFYINLPIGGVALALFAFFRIPEPETKRPAKEVFATAIKTLDLQGFALVCPAAIIVLLGLQFGGNEYAWSSSVVIGLLVGGAVTFAVFLIWEYYQGDNAMIPFAMLRQRIIWSAAGNMCFVLSSILVADYYLAIYFQAIQDASPLISGVHLLPTTLGLVLFTIISGVSIERFGYYLPWVVGGTTISAIGYGLLSLLNPTTSTGKWIGYQVFYGVGSGCSVAAGYIAVQNLVPAAQIPTAMAIVIFCQNMGGATFLILANAIFSNSLRKELQQRAAEINVAPDIIVDAGVRSIRKLVSGKQLAAVLQAYSNSVDNVMYLGIGVSVAAWMFAWGLGFKDIREEKELNAIENTQASSEERDEAKSSS